jgi:phenylalanyl-tRNA synthetase beta chain
MPTVAVEREDLFLRLGRTMSDKEFDELCFQFGIELDDVLTESAAKEARGNNVVTTTTLGGNEPQQKDRVMYYIAIPANRYDLLCIEGLARYLNVFLGNMEAPVSKTKRNISNKMTMRKGRLIRTKFLFSQPVPLL